MAEAPSSDTTIDEVAAFASMCKNASSLIVCGRETLVMDLRFSEEEEQFRAEVREFLEKELPSGWKKKRTGMGGEEAMAASMGFIGKLVQKGWLVGSWPQEYGGRGWTFTQQLIFNEEMSYRGAVRGDFLGHAIAGPAIITYGTEEQKKKHLPPIAKSEKFWCQLFSEPDAGSDLPALKTRAVDSGDEYIVNGQKVWTSAAGTASWGVLLARTNPDVPKREGITYFLLDMKSPGVSINALPAMGLGRHHIHETFLDNVHIPKDCVLGGLEWVNRGWEQARKTLEFERSGIAGFASSQRMLEEMVEYAKENERGGRPLAEDPLVRQRLAAMQTEIEVGRMLSYRVNWMQSQGIEYAYEPAQAKLYSSELSQRLTQLGMWLLGLYGQLEKRSKWSISGGRFERAYLVTPSNTVGGGTTEIMRNNIARRMGLPVAPE